MSAPVRLIVFNGRKSQLFAKAVIACAAEKGVSVDVMLIGGGVAGAPLVAGDQVIVFPVQSDGRIPEEVFWQICATPVSSVVKVAVVGDFASELSVAHMLPLVNEVVRRYTERDCRIENPVLLIDYESVTDVSLVGGWAFGGGPLLSRLGIAVLDAGSVAPLASYNVPASIQAIERIVGNEVGFQCDDSGNCVGLSLATRANYAQSVWPDSYDKQRTLLAQVNRLQSLRHLAIPYARSFDGVTLPLELLRRLGSLDLRGTALDNCDWLVDCRQIERLNLTACHLRKIPPAVWHCARLRRLFLGKNALQQMDGAWRNLEALEVLSLYRNHISVIPAEIGCLVRLRRLNCGANPLRDLPAAMSKLRSLEVLQLDRTKLRTIPEICDSMSALKRVSLRACAEWGHNEQDRAVSVTRGSYSVETGGDRAVCVTIRP